MSAVESMVSNLEQQEVMRLLAFFKNRRYECVDDLPAERITDIDDPKYYLYKCRNNWWQGIAGEMELMVDSSELVDDPELADEIRGFLEFVYGLDPQKFRTREEIDRANKVLEEVIAYLETQK